MKSIKELYDEYEKDIAELERKRNRDMAIAVAVAVLLLFIINFIF